MVTRPKRLSFSPSSGTRLGLLMLLALLGATEAAAQFVVNDAGDQGAANPKTDGTCDGQGPAGCTLRAAVEESNAIGGSHTITFNIAGAGVHQIVLGSAITISSPVSILGNTQAGYTTSPLIELRGSTLRDGLVLAGGSSGSTIRALAINGFTSSGYAAIVIQSSNNTVVGCHLGTNTAGMGAVANAVGIIIEAGSANHIGGTGTSPPDRNIVSGNSEEGVRITSSSASGNFVQGNYIGLAIDGTTVLANNGKGVGIQLQSTNNTVGGATAGQGNVISGNVNGVYVADAGTTGNVIQGNLIGTDATGTLARGNTSRGIVFDVAGAAAGTVGGSAATAGNIVAHNTAAGVWLGGATVGVVILGNSIFDNGRPTGEPLGIDLAGDGYPQANDTGDADSGSNNLQNHPVVSAAMTNGTKATIAGSLNSQANRWYRVEFFANTAADPYGFGEGETYLGYKNVNTDGSGNAVFGATLTTTLAVGKYVAATATDCTDGAPCGTFGSTSEFGDNISAVSSLVVTTTADTVDGTTTSVTSLIGAPGADGLVSLREAILAANATGGADTITFGIPLHDPNHLYYSNNGTSGSLPAPVWTGLGDWNSPSAPNIGDFDADYPSGLQRSWFRIPLTSALPTINEGVTINGAGGNPFLNQVGPMIEVTGASLPAATPCLAVAAGASSTTLRSLIVNQCPGEAVNSSGPSTTVAANYIGTDASGTLARGNGTSGSSAGVYVAGNTSRVGGTAAADRNVISGNAVGGIQVAANGAFVQGNYIGTKVNGASTLGNGYGISITGSAATNRIGGTAGGEGNTIAYNTGAGIRVLSTGNGNVVLGNSIHENGGLGIDLGGDGVTANDPLDLDSGPNDLSNAPAVNLVRVEGANVRVYFALDVPAGSYRIEFFKNAALDASGYGEGELLVSSMTLTHPGGGAAGFQQVFAGAVGDKITATATRCIDGATCSMFGNSSEFSNGATAATTAVRLVSFAARPQDRAVALSWETATELDNLGFWLYRGPSADGPWQRLDGSLIPGVGSSMEGRSYGFVDSGLSNGVTCFYRLEDVDRSGRVTSHGPVSATPGDGENSPPEEAPSSEPGPVGGEGTSSWIAHGDPDDVSLRVVARTERSVTFELRTGGFYSLARADGSSALFVPGFVERAEPGFPTLPTRRTWTEAVVGLGARVASVSAEDVVSFDGLLTPRAGAPQALTADDGTYRVSFRKVRPAVLARGLYPLAPARVLQTAFRGDVKSAYLEFAPLRLHASRSRVILARTMLVTVAFDGVVAGETGTGWTGTRGRVLSRSTPRLIARFATRDRGLYAVGWDDLLAAASGDAVGPRSLTLNTPRMRLSRRGVAVPFHVEPRPDRFVPGSTLYFLSDGAEAAYAGEAVYELAVADGGERMAVRTLPAVSGEPVGSLVASRTFEKNAQYLPGLLEARDRWLWSGIPGGSWSSYPFTVTSLAQGSARLRVDLQGGSDTETPTDHHVRVSIGGIEVARADWDGMRPLSIEADLPPAVLVEGENTLRLDSDSAPTDAVYLDRFSVEYPHAAAAEAGLLEGRAVASGSIQLSGASRDSVVLDVSARPTWLRHPIAPEGLVFSVEAGHEYLAVDPRSILHPEVRPAALDGPSLRDTTRQADWIVVAPRALLPAVEPLRLQRESQGLVAVAVSLEQVYDSFGFGEPSPDAVRDFLAYAYHRWSAPAVRYVLFLGDASCDPKGFFPSAVRRDVVPTPFVKSSFLWTASDPLYAAVNGDDLLPDIAVGRLTAGSLAEAEAAVDKIVDFETATRTLDGKAVLIADDPDPVAGDFEADADDIASLLGPRPVEKIFLSAFPTAAEAHAAVLDAFDSGSSLLSYVGHGSQGLWASEGLLRAPDVDRLGPQARQPFVLTMTCSNGYFVSPWANSISERLTLAPGKGAIAAFSPSGLSLDSAAHLYHRALVHELDTRRHRRIGDLVLAAQGAYLQSGELPELLSLYHLFGDPGLVIQ
jgi:CSLREA domain-containing protein